MSQSNALALPVGARERIEAAVEAGFERQIATTIAFTAIPMSMALYFSLTDFDLRRPDEVQFVGLANYAQILRDPNVIQSLGVTRRSSAGRATVPLGGVRSLRNA